MPHDTPFARLESIAPSTAPVFRPTVVDPSKRKSRIYLPVDGLTIRHYSSDTYRRENSGYINPSTALTFAQLTVDIIENRRLLTDSPERSVVLLMGEDTSSVWLAGYIKLLKPAYLAVKANDLPRLNDIDLTERLVIFADDCIDSGRHFRRICHDSGREPDLAFFICESNPETSPLYNISRDFPHTEFVLLRPSDRYPLEESTRPFCQMSSISPNP